MSESLPSDPILPPPIIPLPPLIPVPPPSSEGILPKPPRNPAPTSAEIEQILHASNPRPRVTQERSEVFDERCWTRCRQTNARRALNREPACSSLCYINMRNHINALLPTGEPGVFLASMNNPKSTITPKVETEVDPNLVPVPAYKWKGLDGRYIYYAKGKELVQNHMNEMGGDDWKGIEALQARCDAAKIEREEKSTSSKIGRREQLAIRRSLGMNDEESYEKLISLSETYTTSLQAFHRHVLRIYTPLFKNLARLPETFKDGTQQRMLETVWTKLSDGSAYTLASRMVTSTIDVAKQLKQRRSGGGGEGGIGGLGGGGTPAS